MSDARESPTISISEGASAWPVARSAWARACSNTPRCGFATPTSSETTTTSARRAISGNRASLPRCCSRKPLVRMPTGRRSATAWNAASAPGAHAQLAA